jgi:hypothetical protein
MNVCPKAACMREFVCKFVNVSVPGLLGIVAGFHLSFVSCRVAVFCNAAAYGLFRLVVHGIHTLAFLLPSSADLSFFCVILFGVLPKFGDPN